MPPKFTSFEPSALVESRRGENVSGKTSKSLLVLKSQIQSEAVPQLISGRFDSQNSQNGRGALMLEERFVKLFDELRIPVFRYLRRIGLRQEETEEIVQDTFLRLFKHLGEKGERGNLRGWVYRVAHNMAVNQYRHQRYLSHLTSEELERLSDMRRDQAPNPEQILVDQDKIARIERAICTLSHRQRECLFLRMEGYRYREIAETLGVTVATVSESLHRAIKKLRGDEREKLNE
jgi:RNA polymerase sigma-70 factor, ECF subfamily